jgi:hypothetical protein
MSKFRRGDKVELIEKYKGYEYKAFDGKYFIVIEVYDHGSITCIDCTHNLHFVRPSEITILEKQPVYYTVPSPEQVDKIDYKKAFEMLVDCFDKSNKDICIFCKSIGVKCMQIGICKDGIMAAIKLKCTEGGE